MNQIHKHITEVEKWLENKDIINEYCHLNLFNKKVIKVDCSMLVFNVLQRSNCVYALNEMASYYQTDDHKERLFASNYLDYFSLIKLGKMHSDYWIIIDINNIQVGDVFVYSKDVPESEYYQHHSMLVYDSKKVDDNKYDIEVFHSSTFGVRKDILRLVKEDGNYTLYYPKPYPESKTVKLKEFLFGRAKFD